jgi:hypothetical protein
MPKIENTLAVLWMLRSGEKVTQTCIDRVSKDTSIMLISTEEGKLCMRG